MFIESPNRINESEYFTVSVIDENGTLINACIVFTAPFHPPRFKYGSSVWLRAPLILDRGSESLKGKITVFKIFANYRVSRDIIVINNRVILQ